MSNIKTKKIGHKLFKAYGLEFGETSYRLASSMPATRSLTMLVICHCF